MHTINVYNTGATIPYILDVFLKLISTVFLWGQSSLAPVDPLSPQWHVLVLQSDMVCFLHEYYGNVNCNTTIMVGKLGVEFMDLITSDWMLLVGVSDLGVVMFDRSYNQKTDRLGVLVGHVIVTL